MKRRSLNNIRRSERQSASKRAGPPQGCMDEDAIFAEYRTWEKSLHDFYDVMIRHGLEWPSLTAQWLPAVTESHDRRIIWHRLILGTQADTGDNHLMIATIALPTQNATPAASRSPRYDTSVPGEGPAPEFGKVEIELKIVHEGEVVRARCMPQNPSLIATRTSTNDVLVYHYTKYQAKADVVEESRPEVRLKGHQAQGRSLSWNPKRAGLLLSASGDHTVRLWDISSTPKKDRTVEATKTYTAHTANVTDVTWHPKDRNLFGSASDDKRAMIWDIRDRDPGRPASSIDGHTAPVNCLSFNHYNEFTLLTGSSDRTVPLWDLRHLDKPLQCLTGHEGAIVQLEWSPSNETVFASAATDRKVFVWDLSRSGEEVPPDAEGPSEVMFVHGGHMTNVTDLDWNPHDPWLICSVAEFNNTLQVWQMAENFSVCEQFCGAGTQEKEGFTWVV